MNYFPFHIGDYAVHTRHLSLMEDLAYRRLIDLYYTRESALPADVAQVARLVGMRDQIEDVKAVLSEFFIESPEGWRHARCDEEILRAHEAAQRARDNGRKGGRPVGSTNNPAVTQRVSSGNPDETKSQAPITQDQDQTTEAIASVGAKAPRGSKKCPASFVLSAELRAFAADRHPGVDSSAETEKFRDYTFRNPISDWSGAWRNWIRKADENRRQPSTFRERDAANAAARVHEMTGGLVSAKPPIPITRRNDALAEVFNASEPARLLG